MFGNFIKNAARYFFQGLLILVPIVLTFYVITYFVLWIGSWLEYSGFSVHPYIDPFIGFLLVIILIVLIGVLGTTIIFQPFLLLLDRLIEKAPLIKTIYTSVKDLLSAFVGQKKRFTKPVLVTVNKEANIQKLGFITQNDLSEIGLGMEKVAVYLPYSYAFSGMLIIVPKENITFIDAGSADIMKFIISGGVTEFETETLN